MKAEKDAYGRQLLAQYHGATPTVEIIERDDDYIDTGSDPGYYFTEYAEWPESEREAIGRARGRILDVGCGAGRHALYLQSKGFKVTGIDNSPGAIKVCRLRGLKRAVVRPIEEIDKFPEQSFDTILMMGNNFGLFGGAENARRILEKMSLITKPQAQIIAGTRDPHLTDRKEHLEYLRFNRRRGRLPGQIRFRIRFGKTIGEWFDFLFVAPGEMQKILEKTDWQVKEFLMSKGANYFAVIVKKN
ncbi:MAG TPA: class I SAM-dependent methyltransferase [Pyrinomonadaceae bacterium]|jgi:SAM-dependent methyltransferase